MPDCLRPHGLYSPWSSPGQNTGVGSYSLLQGIFPTQGSNPGIPHCKEDSLPVEPPGKPKNFGVGSLSFLQQIFLTQESNQGLLHCMRILHQLSYQGSPKCEVKVKAAQSCPTLCDPMDYAVHRILQARTLELGAFPFSRESSQPRD